jgi:hypothetical protein
MISPKSSTGAWSTADLDWRGLVRWELISEKSATLVGCGSNVDDFSEIIYERLECG